MITTHKLFQVLRAPYISEKASIFKKKNNIIIFKVSLWSKKKDIKFAVEKLFSIHVISVNTVLIKKNKRKKGKYNIKGSCWKKAYVKIQSGQLVDSLQHAQ